MRDILEMTKKFVIIYIKCGVVLFIIVFIASSIYFATPLSDFPFPIDADESLAAGVYIAEHSGGRDTLTIHPDHTYEQVYVSPEGQVFKNASTWKIDTWKVVTSRILFGNSKYIEFNSFASYRALEETDLIDGTNIQLKDFWATDIYKRYMSEEILICMKLNKSACYKKQP